MKNRLWFWLALYILTCPVMAQAVEDSSQGQLNNTNQRIVTGVIDKISSSQISVKTDEGKTRTFTIDPSEKSDYVNKGLKKGDRISLSYNHQEQIIGVDKLKESTGGQKNPGSQNSNPQ